jgi:hypothetical protein
MSDIFAAQIAAVANLVLAAFAIITAILAGLAFRKQAREVSDQAAMLELQRQQLADQQAASAKQAEVLELQAKQLQESLEERRQAADEKRRAQAAQVTTWFKEQPHVNGPYAAWGAMVRNNSGLPVLDVRAAFHQVAEPVKGLGWTPVAVGTSLESIRVLPPHTERHLPIAPDLAAQEPKYDDDTYVASITFTDAAGNRWERDPRGALKPFQ